MATSSPSSGFAVPPGQYPPFAVVTDRDHTAWIILATAVGLSCVLLFSGIRILIRSTISPGYGLDDAFVAASTIVTVIQSSVVLGACADGLGKSIELVPLGLQGKIQQMYYASTLLFVIALGFSKISVVFFLRRLSQVPHHRRVFKAAAVLLAAWTFGSTFAVALQCDLTHPWIVIGERCSGSFLRWQIISAFDIISEVGLVGLAIYLVWDLHTSISRKVVVVCAFAFRLPIVIPIAFRLSTFDNAGRSTNLTLLEDLFIVWTQTELNYSIVSATIPALRPFVSKLNTQLGGVGQPGGYGYGSASGTHVPSHRSYQMSSLKPADRSNVVEEDTATEPARIWAGQPNTYSYNMRNASTGVDVNNSRSGEKWNAATSGVPSEEKINADATSVGSNDSRQLIIRKDVSYEVEEAHHEQETIHAR